MEKLWQVEANIDDMNPQAVEYVFECLFKAGANDAWAVPILMKKSRMAMMLCVLCQEKTLTAVLDILFRETTTIGARYFPVDRQVCDRVMQAVIVDGEQIGVKISSRNGCITTISAEYDDCRRAAAHTAIPLKEWQRKAIEEAYKQYGHQTG